MKTARLAAPAKATSVLGGPRDVCERAVAFAAADKPLFAFASALLRESATSNILPTLRAGYGRNRTGMLPSRGGKRERQALAIERNGDQQLRDFAVVANAARDAIGFKVTVIGLP